MSSFLDTHHTALPPPRSTHVEHDGPWPCGRLLAPVALVVGTLIVIILAVVSALTLLAVTPPGFALPTTLMLIGALAAGSLAIRRRMVVNRHALAEVPRSPSGAPHVGTPAGGTVVLASPWRNSTRPLGVSTDRELHACRL